MNSITKNGLKQTIERNLSWAQERVLEQIGGQDIPENNLNAMVALEAMRTAEIERHNLRSMQAWIACKVAKEKTYLDYPITEEFPQGIGNMKEWLSAVGISGSSMYELYYLSEIVAPLFEEQGEDIYEYLRRDKYSKLAEAVTVLKRIASGEEEEYEFKEVMEDINNAPNRDDIRSKYRDERFLADGAVNKVDGEYSTLTIYAPDEHVQSLLRGLQGKVEWHLSVIADSQSEHEIVLRVPR